MKIPPIIAVFLLCAGCASQPSGDPCGLGLTPEELITLKSNVRRYLRSELAGSYVYYDVEGSILNAVVTFDGSCAVLIYPAGETDDGTTLLHGEGIVLFDRESLQPNDVQFFGW